MRAHWAPPCWLARESRIHRLAGNPFLHSTHDLCLLTPQFRPTTIDRDWYFSGGKDRYEGNVGLVFCRVPSTSYAKNTTRTEPNPNEAAFVEKVGFATLEISRGGRLIAGKAYAVGSDNQVTEVDAFTLARHIGAPMGAE